jgi:hypothetical protein
VKYLTQLANYSLYLFFDKCLQRSSSTIEPYRLEEYIKRKEQVVHKQLETSDKVIPELAKVANRSRQNDRAEIFSGYRGIRTPTKYFSEMQRQRMYYAIFIHLKDTIRLQVHFIQGYIYFKSIRKYNKEE